MRPKVISWVQTRMGLGHLARTINICAALSADGFDVVLAHGGPPVPALRIPSDVTYAQLPIGIAPDLATSQIFDEQGRPVDEAWKAARITALMSLIEQERPDIFMTETFPLGRRMFSELTPVISWLRQIRPRPLLVSSVRDIVTRPTKAAKAQAMVEEALQNYDLILCHSDPEFVRLPDGFPETAKLAHMTRYTGYVVDTPEQTAGDRRGIIVLAGGGAAGGELFKTVSNARTLWPESDEFWRIVTGPRFNLQELEVLRQNAPKGIAIEGAVDGLAKQFAHARLVVAQAGYNTVCEVLSHGAKLTVVPYATPKETEQTIRAQLFSRRRLLTMVEPIALSPSTLVDAMRRALALDVPSVSPDFQGADKTVRILREALSDRSL